MLSARDISIRYGERLAVEHVSLDVAEHTVTALIGANGAGKTSLLKALNGVVPISSGVIEIDGRDIRSLTRRETARRIAVVAQENETRFPITVSEFILAGRFAHGGNLGWESADDLSAATRAITDCELTDLAQRQMNHLSGGERQRVVLARALASGARILLLDEPTANLDLAHQTQMLRLVRERCRRHGGAAVVITHDLNLASEYADEIVLLADRRVAARGAPAEVLTTENILRVFAVDVLLDRHPISGSVRVTNIYT